jgi:ribosomal protein S18 acetylase RimI-like enzyme
MHKTVINTLTKEDIQKLLPIHIKAFKGFINVLLGALYLQRFFQWFVNYPESICIKAEYDNKIAGYIVGARLGYRSQMTKSLRKNVIQAFITKPFILANPIIIRAALETLVYHLGSKKEMKLPQGKGISLVGIGVDPQLSGKKIGQNLIAEFERRAARQGYDFMMLSVHNHNKKAIGLYLKSGWVYLEASGKTVSYYYKPINIVS